MPKKKTIVFAKDRPIYDRQPDEPEKLWFAFKTYRDLTEERAHRAVATIYRKKYKVRSKVETLITYLSKHSVIWRWKERANEWDRMIDTRLRNRKMRAREEMEARHLELAYEASATAMIGLRAIKKAAEKAKAEGKEHLTVASVLDLAKFGVTTERTAKGEPSKIEEQRHKVDVDDKRKALQKLAENPELLDSFIATMDEDE
jgi:hypothetical protein